MRNAIISEWTKFRTVRSTLWTLSAVAGLPVVVAVLVAVTRSLMPGDTVLAGAIGNSVIGQVAAAILGVLVAAGEYGNCTIRATMAANPRRVNVLLAKAVLTGTAIFVVSLIASALALLAAAALLDTHPLGAPVPALLGVSLIYAAVSVLGLALGFVVRHPAGAVTAATGFLLLPVLLAPLLGARQRVVELAPLGATQRLAEAGTASWLGVAVVCANFLAALVASAWLLTRRDV
jgi:ABC-2 type transport system permease protein